MLNSWSYRKRLAKEAYSSPATRGLKKDSDRAIPPLTEAVHVPAHLAPPRSLQGKQLSHHAQLSRAELPQAKKVLRRRTQGRFSCVWALCDPVDWPARLLCQGVGGFSSQRYWSDWPILVAISFSSTVFPAALAASSPKRVLPEPL